MNLILKISWRNILRHRGKSIVIGVILFLGAFLMTVGNGVVAGMGYGIKKNIVNAFMGDIVLISDKQKSDNVLLDFMGRSIETISTYKQIKEVLRTQNYVDRFLPVGKNLTMVLNEDESTPGMIFLLGVDIEALQKMFPGNFKAIEGRTLEPGEKGLLVPTFAREELYNYTPVWLVPEGGALVKEHMKKELRDKISSSVVISSNIVLMGMSSGLNSTSDIRFNVKGIIKYNALNTIFGHFCLCDIESYRQCLGYFSASETAIEVPKEEQKLLNMQSSDIDALFGSESLVVPGSRKEARRPVKTAALTPKKEKVDIEDGIYNIIFVKLKDGVSYKTALDKLNPLLKEAKTGARAVTWNAASGPIGSMTLIIKGALFVFVTLLFFVAIIIIVNTLTMAALERTSEIGMMRAVGARKSFIGGMFIGETGILSAVFGGAGIVCGITAVKLIPVFKITTTNDMVQLLYGGDIFSPMLNAQDIIITVLQLALVTAIAAFYPVIVARNITPLDAIQRD